MYDVGERFAEPFNYHIDSDGREFYIDCIINSFRDLTSHTVDLKHIGSIKIDKDLVSGAEEYTIGNLGGGKLSMTFDKNMTYQIREYDTIDLTFNLKIIDPETQLPTWIGMPMGHYTIFNITSTILSQTVEAYDDFYRNEMFDYYISALKYPTTSREILEELCGHLGILYSEDIPNVTILRPTFVYDYVLNSDGKYEEVISESNQVGLGMQVGQALGYIASYLGGNFIVDGDRVLKFLPFPTKKVKSYNFDKYSMPTVSESKYDITRLSCAISKSSNINVGEGTDGKTLVFDNAFMTPDQLKNIILPKITNIEYYPIKTRIKGDPRIELGDLIEIYETDSNGFIINRQTIPVLKMSISYSGGFSMDIESVCRSEAEISRNYKGSISSRLDSLENEMHSSFAEIQTVIKSMESLKTLKELIDDMNDLIYELPTDVSDYEYDQYSDLYNVIRAADMAFEEKYIEVYNSPYLK